MSKEENYKNTLLHVVDWLLNNGDTWKPVNASFANKIAEICQDVARNDTSLEEAIDKVNHHD